MKKIYKDDEVKLTTRWITERKWDNIHDQEHAGKKHETIPEKEILGSKLMAEVKKNERKKGGKYKLTSK